MADSDSPAGLWPRQNVEATRAASASRPARVRDATLSFRPDIDGLRAVAVGLVVAYHAFPKLRTGGFIGVDVFFVISGYLITQIILTGLQAGTFSLGAFYQRRVRRIVPALLLVAGDVLPVRLADTAAAELLWLGRSVAWCAPFLANVFFARIGTGYFDSSTGLTPLLHLWSLGVEEQFYFAWPVLLMVAVQRGITMRALLAVTATSLAISIWGIWHAPLQYFYLPASRAWELAVGGILAAWRPGMPRTAAAAKSSIRSLQGPRRAGELVGGSGAAGGSGRLSMRQGSCRYRERHVDSRRGTADLGRTARAGEPRGCCPPADDIRRADQLSAVSVALAGVFVRASHPRTSPALPWRRRRSPSPLPPPTPPIAGLRHPSATAGPAERRWRDCW